MTGGLKTLYENYFINARVWIKNSNSWKAILKSKSFWNCSMWSECHFQNLQKLKKGKPNKRDLSFPPPYVPAPSSSLNRSGILSTSLWIHSLEVVISYSSDDFGQWDLSRYGYGTSRSVPHLTTSTTRPEEIGRYRSPAETPILAEFCSWLHCSTADRRLSGICKSDKAPHPVTATANCQKDIMIERPSACRRESILIIYKLVNGV